MAASTRVTLLTGAFVALLIPSAFAEKVGVVQDASPTYSDTSVIDNALHERVRDGWYNISILSTRDEVVLQGQVDNERTRQSVLQAARSVVQKPVRDDLQVKAPIPDNEVALELRRSLEKEYPNLFNSVDVSVQNGVARLDGDLKSQREVDQVLATAMNQKGIQDIESDLTVRGRPYPAPESANVEGKY